MLLYALVMFNSSISQINFKLTLEQVNRLCSRGIDPSLLASAAREHYRCSECFANVSALAAPAHSRIIRPLFTILVERIISILTHLYLVNCFTHTLKC